MDLDNWTKTIAERRWPILPDTLSELRDACARHSDLINFTDLANLCLSDPFLLLDLFRVVGNSRALQRNESIPAVEQTLLLMGLEAVVTRFNRVEALEICDGKLDADVYEAVGDWMARSRVAALIVKEWLSIMGDVKVEDCFVSALLYNMPACIYMLQRNQLPDRPLLQEMSEAFSADYGQILQAFVKHMPLPVGFNTLLGPGAPNKRRQLLKLAIATANSLDHGVERSTWLVGVDTAAKMINCMPEMAYNAVVHAVLNVAKRPHVVGYTFPARSLLLLPSNGKGPEMKKAAALSGEDQLANAIRESIRFLANDLKFERVLYFHYEHDQHALKLRYQVGVDADSPLRRLQVELEPGSFFGVFTSKPQSFHAPADVRQQLSRRYEDEFFQHVGDYEFALMTLFGGHRLSGVFYVDNARTGRVIDDSTYHRFKDLVTRLAQH
ncbi:histidine kinase [Chromobacterium phragmitis]|uniref:HDOD domain-containing protein n=1 Tax=Chromobacterium phragmitis TaxID=2202141 RepID=UPI000DEC30C1|nr:HDOD domain-containing protein [Chromobacterium phragmitis]AXE31488.1 histidine kinase [Chromobacterium phragmitis]